MKHIVLYSHGFGVRKDDRGQFPDIAVALPAFKHVMFEYNDVDEVTNTMTVEPIDAQAEKLKEEYQKLVGDNPDAIIDIVCHSQGCTVAAVANLPARKTIFLAPPKSINIARTQQFFGDRAGASLDPNGMSKVPRKDGSTTQIPASYWKSLENLDLPKLYKKLAHTTELFVLVAQSDDVLERVEVKVSGADNQVLPGDHNFAGDDRAGMVKVVKEILAV